MHQQLNEQERVTERPGSGTLVSIDPTTGEEIWSGKIGDAAAEVAGRDGGQNR